MLDMALIDSFSARPTLLVCDRHGTLIPQNLTKRKETAAEADAADKRSDDPPLPFE